MSVRGDEGVATGLVVREVWAGPSTSVLPDVSEGAVMLALSEHAHAWREWLVVAGWMVYMVAMTAGVLILMRRGRRR